MYSFLTVLVCSNTQLFRNPEAASRSLGPNWEVSVILVLRGWSKEIALIQEFKANLGNMERFPSQTRKAEELECGCFLSHIGPWAAPQTH